MWRDHCSFRRVVILLPLALLFVLAGTDAASVVSSGPGPAARFDLPYDLAHPDVILELRGRLDEISGIVVVSDTVVAAVEDERGRIYRVDLRTGEEIGHARFGSDGDYEDLALRDGTLWVLDSDGDLFRVESDGDDLDSDRIETPLTAAYDTEGLAVDPETGMFWIAAKEFPGRGYEGMRAVYAYDPDRRTMVPDPVLLVPIRAVAEARGRRRGGSGVLERLTRPLVGPGRFRPSALAFLPGSDVVLVLSSSAPILAALDRGGMLLGVYELPEYLRQPEGMAFTAGGDLLISSEAAGDRARIVRYKRLDR